MAQGNSKLKKTQKKKLSQKQTKVKSGAVKKGGPKTITPKGGPSLEAHKVKRIIEKSIHKTIESELSARAYQVEEGKNFKIIEAKNITKTKKKKKN